MLSADVTVAQREGLFARQRENPLRARRKRDRPRTVALAATDPLDDPSADQHQRDAHRCQDSPGNAVTDSEQTQQQVLAADVIVRQSPGFLLGLHHDLTGILSHQLKHPTSISGARPDEHNGLSTHTG